MPRSVTPERRMERALIKAAERDRRELGQHLHDTLCQSLSGISIIVSLLERRSKAGEPVNPAHVEELGAMVSHALEEARALSRRLHPVQPEGGGLMVALEELAQSATASVPCAFRCAEPVLIEDAELALALYRIAEEAVKEALPPAAAERIALSLTQSRGKVTLEVRATHRVGVPAGEEAGAELTDCRARAAGVELTRTVQAGQRITVACALVTR